MKMRKLFAGIAAAATLLGGMALGAASAQADGAATTTRLAIMFSMAPVLLLDMVSRPTKPTRTR